MQNRALNADLVLQELTLPRICSKVALQARLRRSLEPTGPSLFVYVTADCLVESVIGRFTASIECPRKWISMEFGSNGALIALECVKSRETPCGIRRSSCWDGQ